MLLREVRRRECRRNLTAFCTDALAPQGLKPALHHRLMLRELQAVADGRTKRLMIFMPPGAAKSLYASKLFPAWWMAQGERRLVITAAHTQTLADKISSDVQDIVRANAATLGYGLGTEAKDHWKTSNGAEFRAAGVGAKVTGFRAQLACLDDLVPGAEAADSEKQRENIWEWYLRELDSRLTPGAPVVLCMTRWHQDDIAGRLLATGADQWRVVKLPALAGDDDPLGRAPGEPLWSDDSYGYGAHLLQKQRELEAAGASRVWASLYQQSPTPGEGALFKVAQLGVVDAVPAGTRFVRAWDLAATAQTGSRDPDWTVGVLLGRTAQDTYVIADVVRLRGGPDEVERAIVATAQRDGAAVRISLPQDPGQAGKAQIAYLTRRLAGFRVESSPETGDKATRAAPVASQLNIGNVSMLRAPWNVVLVDELSGFPAAAKDDQVDALSRAFAALVTPAAAPARFVPSFHMGR